MRTRSCSSNRALFAVFTTLFACEIENNQHGVSKSSSSIMGLNMPQLTLSSLSLSSSPAHYVTPFTSEAAQIVHQPMSVAPGSLGALSAVVTTGYDLSQVQPAYSQQLMAAAGSDRGAILSGANLHSLAAANRTSPQTVSAVSVLLR